MANIVSNPTSPQSITGEPLSLTDTAPFYPAVLDSIAFADQYAGSDLGAKINAAASSFSGASGEVWVSQATAGNTISTAVTLPSGIVLRFIDGGTYILSATITMGSNTAVIGTGKWQTILQASSTMNAALCVFSGVNNAVLKALTLDGNRGTLVAPVNTNNFNAITVVNSYEILIEEVAAGNCNIANGLGLAGGNSYITISCCEFYKTGAPLPLAEGGGVGGNGNGNSCIAFLDCEIHDNNVGMGFYNGGNAPSGLVNTSGISVTWVSGGYFDTGWTAGQPIIINSVQYYVSSVASSTSLTLTASAGVQASVAYSTDYDSTDILVQGCSFHHNADDGFQIDIAEPGGANIKGIRLIGNVSYVNGWPANGTGFPSAYAPGFLQEGPNNSSSGVGFDIIGGTNLSALHVIGNTLHDNLVDGLSFDSRTNSVVNTSPSGTVTWVSGALFNPSWNSGQLVFINGVSYSIDTVTSTTSLTVVTSPGNQSGVGFQGCGRTNSTVTGNISYNNTRAGFFNYFADYNIFAANQAFNNGLNGFWSVGGAYNQFTADTAISNGQALDPSNQYGFLIDSGVDNSLIGVTANDPQATPTQLVGVYIGSAVATQIISQSVFGSTAPVVNGGRGTTFNGAGYISTVNTNYSLQVYDNWVNCSGTITVTVPLYIGYQWNVFNVGSGTVTLVPTSGTINGAFSITLSPNTGKLISSDGTNVYAH